MREAATSGELCSTGARARVGDGAGTLPLLRHPMSEIEQLLAKNPLFARHLIRLLIAKTRSLVKQVRDWL